MFDNLKELAKEKRAQSNLTGLMLGILIAAIVGVNVFIPVVNDAINNSNASGTTLTILELLPLFAALLILVALASPLMRRL
jgi:E3 ubiquitin-protein ligase DOA10